MAPAPGLGGGDRGALPAVLICPAWRYTSIGADADLAGARLADGFHPRQHLILLLSLAVFSLLRVIRMLTGASDGQPIAAEEI